MLEVILKRANLQSTSVVPAEAAAALGMLLLRQKQPREAVPLLEAAAEKKPKELRPVLYLAEALLASGEFARAEPRAQRTPPPKRSRPLNKTRPRAARS